MPQNLWINLKMTTFHCEHSCLQTEDPQNFCLIFRPYILLPTLFWTVQMLNCIRTLCEAEDFFILFFSLHFMHLLSTFEPALSPQEFLPPNLPYHHNRPYHHKNFYRTIGSVNPGISTPQSALSPPEFLPHNQPYHHRNFYPIIGPITTGISTPQPALSPQSALSPQEFLPHNWPYHHRNFYPTIGPITTGISTP